MELMPTFAMDQITVQGPATTFNVKNGHDFPYVMSEISDDGTILVIIRMYYACL